MIDENSPLIIDQFRNNNAIGEIGFWRANRRRAFFLIGCLGLVGLIGTVAVFIPNQNTNQSTSSSLLRNARSIVDNNTKLEEITVKSLRNLAKKVGSTALDSKKDEDELCKTEGCLNTALVLLNSINFSVNPCDDFFEFSCGKWISQNKIPPSNSRWSQFNQLRDEVNNMTQEILAEAKDTKDPKPVNQAKDFYKDCIDLESLKAVGVKPILNVLQQAKHGNWPILIGSSWKVESFDWLETIAHLRRIFQDTVLFSVYVDQDLKNSEKYALYIDQGTLTFPRDMMINADGSYDSIHEAFVEFVVSAARILAADSGTVLKLDNIKAQAKEILEFESEIAKLTTKDEERSETERMYNPFTLTQLQTRTDAYGDLGSHLGIGLDWYRFLSSIFESSGVKLSNDERIIVLETDYIKGLIPLLMKTNPRTIANYIQFRTVSGLAGETTQELRDAAFKFNKMLTGAKEPQKRTKTCADAANNGFGMAVGVKYLAKTKFDEAAKKDVNDMVGDLLVSFKELVRNASWMDDKTRETALDKADRMKTFMAFPDWLTDVPKLEKYYENLELPVGNYFESVSKLSQWTGDKSLANIRKPVDREKWLSDPVVVNAFYAPTYNSITFPAGILQTPFFKRGAPSSVNYGGIGVVIGHEITHGFDNSGRQYDAAGNANPWWTPETLEEYTKRANCIRDQYSAFKPPEVPLNVNGQLTLGENIADNGGVRESYLAYQKYIAKNGVEKPLPGLEKLDPEQLFFLGYANVWCEAITKEGLTNQILTDPHSPARFRVWGPISNNEEFAKKWNCKSGTKMNPGNQNRCTLW